MGKRRIKYMKETVLVFKDPVQDAFERQEDLSGVAWQQDWELCEINKRGEHNPFSKGWMTEDEKSGITYIENHLIDIPYIVIRGENQQHISEVLSKKFEFYTLEELQDFIYSNPENDVLLARAISLFDVALGKSSFNEKFFRVYEFCLTHPIANVRRAAMFATSGVGWPEFRPILENIRDNDSDSELRGYANTTLEALQTYHWNPKVS
jgi:hypothetical protein